jgi:hypothetical protein
LILEVLLENNYGALSNKEVRQYYHEQLDSILSKIDPELPLKERALIAFKLRNEIKIRMRNLMVDRTAAKALPAPKTLRDLVRKAYLLGYRGDQVWLYMLHGSQRSNATYDAALGLKR